MGILDVELRHVITVLVTCTIIQRIDGSCNSEQISACKTAVRSDELDSYPESGNCHSNTQFAGYTHTCSIRHYLLGIDYCCCKHELKVMCCRYLSNQGLFRCEEGDDTIEHLPPESIPLKVLIPAILIPLVVLCCCVMCVIKCCCYKYDSDDNDYCDIPCFRQSNMMNKSKEKENKVNTTHMSSEDQLPLNRHSSITQYNRQPSLRHPPSTVTQFSTDSTNSESKLLPNDSDVTLSQRGQPSAPPVEELDEFPVDDSSAFMSSTNNEINFTRLNSETSTISTPPYQAFPPVAHYTRSNSGISVMTNQTTTSGLPACPNCSTVGPPPTYDEHHNDKVCV